MPHYKDDQTQLGTVGGLWEDENGVARGGLVQFS